MYPEKTVPVNGLTIAYHENIPQRESVSIIMIHGLGGGKSYWLRNFPHFKDYHVLALDLPGSGNSELPENYHNWNLENIASFIIAFLDVLKINKAILIGNSMGGGIALNTALLYPDRIKALILTSPAAIGNKLSLMFRVLAIPTLGPFLLNLAPLNNQEYVKKSLTQMVTNPIWDQELIDYTIELTSKPTFAPSLLAALQGRNITLKQQKEFTLTEQLKDILTPTLVIWGKDDNILSVENSRYVSQMPNAQLEIWDSCGHLAQLEYPEKFFESSIRFLSQHF